MFLSRPSRLIKRPMYATSRLVTFYIDTELGMDIEQKLRQVASYSEAMGSDPYPHHRKEYMKPKERRFMENNRKIGKIANYKVFYSCRYLTTFIIFTTSFFYMMLQVRSLVDFINFKKAHNYR
jgi:hypothetical protein